MMIKIATKPKLARNVDLAMLVGNILMKNTAPLLPCWNIEIFYFSVRYYLTVILRLSAWSLVSFL